MQGVHSGCAFRVYIQGVHSGCTFRVFSVYFHAVFRVFFPNPFAGVPFAPFQVETSVGLLRRQMQELILEVVLGPTFLSWFGGVKDKEFIYIYIYICCEAIIWAKFGHFRCYYLGQVGVIIWAKLFLAYKKRVSSDFLHTQLSFSVFFCAQLSGSYLKIAFFKKWVQKLGFSNFCVLS